MRKLKALTILLFFSVAFTLGACAEDENMQEILDNSELSQASDPNLDGSGDDGDDKDETGGM